MRWLLSLLAQVPHVVVLKERVDLAEDKYEGAVRESKHDKQRIAALERENEALRAQSPFNGVTEDMDRALADARELRQDGRGV